jgi:hypothetical protein
MSEHSKGPLKFPIGDDARELGLWAVACLEACEGLKPEAIPKLVAFCERLEKRARYDSSALGRETVGLAELLAEVKGDE